MILLFAMAVVGCDSGTLNSTSAKADANPTASFSELAVWDDGLAEICYYDAVDNVYGVPRTYTRVMLANREWLNPDQMVKAESPDAAAGKRIPVFKTNIIEEIPTENYSYRFMVTIFLGRPDLHFQKLAASSQEWCGTTFKRIVRTPDALRMDTFSYFEGEADRNISLPTSPDIYPREALFLLARQVTSNGEPISIQFLPRLRSSHTAEPQLSAGTLTRDATTRIIQVPCGNVRVHTVTLRNAGGDRIASYDVEATAPFRIVAHEHHDGLRLKLRYSERRAYWDRSQPSRFYRQGDAP